MKIVTYEGGNTIQPIFDWLKTKGTISSFGLDPYNFAQEETGFSDSLIFNWHILSLRLKKHIFFPSC